MARRINGAIETAVRSGCGMIPVHGMLRGNRAGPRSAAPSEESSRMTFMFELRCGC